MTVAEIAARLAAGETTAVALTEGALDRVAAVDAALRAFITVTPEAAQQAAAESDRRRAEGRALGPLDGVPLAVKDNLAVRGLPRWNGTRAFPEPMPQDAAAVARLRAAGVVILGTLNMHEGALGATTDNPFWGRCENPLAPGHTPGGSSGGSAAAVAAGIVPLALGTDTMGSVRIPAAYCGLWGLKPTRGLVPATGLAPLSWTLDTIGPIATSPGDLATALSALAGPDPGDPLSVPLPPGWSPEAPPPDLRRIRIGLPDAGALAQTEPVLLAAVEDAVERLRATGAEVVPIRIEGWDPGPLRRAGLLVCEAEAAEWLGPELDARPEGFSEGFRRLIDYGRRAEGVRVAAAYHRLSEAARAAAWALGGFDALLLPTAPQRAFPHGAPAPANQADFTALANVAGLPALALPWPAPDGGLPASLQLVGPAFSEGRLLALGAALAGLARPQ